MILTSVYGRPDRVKILWDLLAERDPTVSISHKEMPSLEQHRVFVESKPYEDWCFVETPDGLIVGAVYLTALNEIGIHIFREYQDIGFGRWAVREIMKKHGPRRYLANINPQNERSALMFKKLGFNLAQHTYECLPSCS